MRTLHFGLRVADLTRSLEFYTGLGYEAIGNVPETEFGSLTMLKLPGDEFVSLERPASPDGSDDFWTSWLTDPDGYRIELVQWPTGHPDGMTEADMSGQVARD